MQIRFFNYFGLNFVSFLSIIVDEEVDFKLLEYLQKHIIFLSNLYFNLEVRTAIHVSMQPQYMQKYRQLITVTLCAYDDAW